MLSIGIESDYRNSGLGGVLVTMAIDWARRQTILDFIKVFIFFENTPALRLAEKLGFVEFGHEVDAVRISGRSIDVKYLKLDLKKSERTE